MHLHEARDDDGDGDPQTGPIVIDASSLLNAHLGRVGRLDAPGRLARPFVCLPRHREGSAGVGRPAARG